jgi:hypothetical protein
VTKRITPRLAFAEYVFPDAKLSEQVWRARLEIINVSKRIHRDFLLKLSSDVFPLFVDRVRRGVDFDEMLWTNRSPFQSLPNAWDLKRMLSRWADNFNAQQEWLLDDALRTFGDWYVAPDWRDQLRWHQTHPSETVVHGEDFSFQTAAWEPQLQSWQQYKSFVLEQANRSLKHYEANTRSLAESKGLVRVQRTYEPENFEWFVLYQLAGWSSTKIADGSKPARSESTIMKGIKAAASIAKWQPLRATRPKGSRKVRE